VSEVGQAEGSNLKTHSSGVTCETHWYLANHAWGMWTDTQIVYVRKENYSNCVENVTGHRTNLVEW